MEKLDNRKSKTIVENVILKGANDFGVGCKFGDGAGVERLNPAGVDEGDAVATGFELFLGFEGELHHGPQRDEADVGSFLEDLCLTDGEEFGFLLDGGTWSVSPRVADGDRAVLVVCHGPKHVDEFIFILWLHVDEAGHMAKIPNVKKTVVGRAIIA